MLHLITSQAVCSCGETNNALSLQVVYQCMDAKAVIAVASECYMHGQRALWRLMGMADGSRPAVSAQTLIPTTAL